MTILRMLSAAEKLLEEVQKLLPAIRARDPGLAKQLERAVRSCLLNTSQGIGAHKPKVKVRDYDVACGESDEVRACLRAAVIRGILTPVETRKAHNLASAFYKMLTSASLKVMKSDHPGA
jgi:four helix bundle protein